MGIYLAIYGKSPAEYPPGSFYKLMPTPALLPP